MSGVEGASLLPPAIGGSPKAAGASPAGLLLQGPCGGSSPTFPMCPLSALDAVSGS